MHGDSNRPATILAGSLIPSWLISILVHLGLLIVMAEFTWRVVHPAPEREFTVGIMVRKDSPQGQAFESKDNKFVSQTDPTTQNTRFLPDANPTALAESLPKLPEPDLSTIGITGSVLSGSSQIIELPDGSAGTGIMAPTQFFGSQVWGTKFVFVIDHSGSMRQRDRLGAAKRELMASLAKLPPEAQFQIVFYNVQPEAILHPKNLRLHFATDQNRLLASREMDKIIADNGTEHFPALKMALSLRPDVIFFLTDADDLGDADVRAVTEANRSLQARIHTIEFGIGAEVDRENQLRELSRLNGGTYRYVDAATFDRRGREVSP